jgi:hypothetical protein
MFRSRLTMLRSAIVIVVTLSTACGLYMMNTIAAVQRECASFIENLRSVKEVQESINKRYDELFWHDENGHNRPFLCTLCDEVLMGGTGMKLLDPEVLKKNKELFYVE